MVTAAGGFGPPEGPDSFDTCERLGHRFSRQAWLLHQQLEVPEFQDSIGPHEQRALTPLFWTHINPYGRFQLDMTTRLDLERPQRESIL